MIKKIRRKFITISMISIFLVLFGILAVINLTSYYNINKRADKILTILTENSGRFPKLDKPAGNKPPHNNDMSPETPFENRFFTVYFDNNGNINASDTGYISAITTEKAVEFATEVYSKKKSSGFISNYKFSVKNYSDGKLIVFLDCTRDFTMFSDFLTTSILISFLGILLVFLLVLLLSKIAMKPICESYAKQKRFITDASHEIKTPLSIISANTEVIEMENGESRWTNSTNQQIKRLTNLTNQLISLSRMEEENTQISKTDFSLSNAILETTEPFSAIAQTKNKKFEIAVSPNISYYGDEKSLRQLFSILLDNAFKYSDENGNIKVSLKKSGVKKEIIFFNTVEDISVGSHNDFFDRFYRNDTSRNSKTGGYGIGLSLAKSIVELHKGKIKAFSVDGKSFTISILL